MRRTKTHSAHGSGMDEFPLRLRSLAGRIGANQMRVTLQKKRKRRSGLIGVGLWIRLRHNRRTEMNIQSLFDDMSANWQRERAETQMTLGKLIAALEAMPNALAQADAACGVSPGAMGSAANYGGQNEN